MRKEYQEYWFPIVEHIEDYDCIVSIDNYIRFRDKSHRTILRFINGEVIQIKGSIYHSIKHKGIILKLYKKLFLRFLKEKHKKINNNYKNALESRSIGEFINFGFLDYEFSEMIKLYIYKL